MSGCSHRLSEDKYESQDGQNVWSHSDGPTLAARRFVSTLVADDQPVRDISSRTGRISTRSDQSSTIACFEGMDRLTRDFQSACAVDHGQAAGRTNRASGSRLVPDTWARAYSDSVLILGSNHAPPYAHSHGPHENGPQHDGHGMYLHNLQPCRDFLHNRCFKGDKCIYSHDIDHIRHVNTPQDGSCMSFIFGVCDLPVCRFRHDVAMVKNLLLAELERQPIAGSSKAGVCLEYLKGTCLKGEACPFSHDLKDYYAHVCKRKPRASVGQRSASESLLAALVAESTGSAQPPMAPSSERCRRSHALRCLIPMLIHGDPKRCEAIIAALEAHPSIAPGILSIYDMMLQQNGGGSPMPPPQAPPMPPGMPPAWPGEGPPIPLAPHPPPPPMPYPMHSFRGHDTFRGHGHLENGAVHSRPWRRRG